jgi:hypothetical protein
MLTRRDWVLGIAASLAGAGRPGAGFAQAAPGIPWARIPTITILANPGDVRLKLVRDAVAFWNRTLREIGSTFRLGAIAETVGAIPLPELAMLGDAVLRRAGPMPASDRLRAIPGNIVVALSDGDFISFAARWPELEKALVAIKSAWYAPLNIPNVARNVIAHEFGHAIGLRHNGGARLLMCGRPATCRPDAFASPNPRYFPLSDHERAALLRLYPASWPPRYASPRPV